MRKRVKRLIEILQDEDWRLRWAAAEVLCGLGRWAKPAVPALIAALQDERTETRRAAARALGQLGHKAKAAVSALGDALKDERTRSHAADALANIGFTAVPVLVETLKCNKGYHLRCAAANALGWIGPQAGDAVPALISLLSDKRSIVRLVSAYALRHIGPAAREALPVLSTMAREDEERDGREAAEIAIQAIRGS